MSLTDLQSDFLWMPRVNQTVYGKEGIFRPEFNSNIIAVLADTTNINRSNIAGYLYQLAKIQLGVAEVGNRYTLPNKQLKVFIFPEIARFQFKFTLATPVGNCKIQIWEALAR